MDSLNLQQVQERLLEDTGDDAPQALAQLVEAYLSKGLKEVAKFNLMCQDLALVWMGDKLGLMDWDTHTEYELDILPY